MKSKGCIALASQTYHHGDLKSQLIREGLLILDQDGYEGFSLRKVAKACNVSQTAPYRHFKNKDELIAAIMTEAMQAFNRSLQEAVVQYPDDPEQQLKEMGIAYIHFFSNNPEYLHLLFSRDLFHKLSTVSGEEYQNLCGRESHFQAGHPFATFFCAVKNYAEAFPNECMGLDALILYCWGLVHGISVLISNKEKFPHGGIDLELAEKIIRNEQFLTLTLPKNSSHCSDLGHSHR